MRYVLILAVLSAFTADAFGQAKTLRVCVDASGVSTYTDQPCPAASKEKSAVPVDPSMSRSVQSPLYAADSTAVQRSGRVVYGDEPRQSEAAKRKLRCNAARAHEASERKRLGNRITGQQSRDLTDATWDACYGR